MHWQLPSRFLGPPDNQEAAGIFQPQRKVKGLGVKTQTNIKPTEMLVFRQNWEGALRVNKKRFILLLGRDILQRTGCTELDVSYFPENGPGQEGKNTSVEKRRNEELVTESSTWHVMLHKIRSAWCGQRAPDMTTHSQRFQPCRSPENVNWSSPGGEWTEKTFSQQWETSLSWYRVQHPYAGTKGMDFSFRWWKSPVCFPSHTPHC